MAAINLQVNSLRSAIELYRAGYDEEALEKFEECLSEKQVGKINAIMLSKLSPLPGVYLRDEHYGTKIRFIPGLPDALQKEWEPHAQKDLSDTHKERLFKTVQVFVISRPFLRLLPPPNPISTTPLLDKDTPLTTIIFSHLDVKELCTMASCSHRLRQKLSLPNPRIWIAAARTFSLPDRYWPVYSKEQARENFSLLAHFNDTFEKCCKHSGPHYDPGLRERIMKFANCQVRGVRTRNNSPPPDPLAFPTKNPRLAFLTHTRRLIQAITDGSKSPGQPLNDLLHQFTDCQQEALPAIDSFIEMFFACGELGNQKTFSKIENYYSISIELKRGGTALGSQEIYRLPGDSPRVQQQLRAYELLANYGVVANQENSPTFSFGNLFRFFDNTPAERIERILWKLIERGARADKECLGSYLCHRGPLEQVERFIREANATVSPDNLFRLLRDYAPNDGREGGSKYIPDADTLLKVAKLLIEKCPKFSRPDYDISTLVQERYNSLPELQEKLVKLLSQ